MASFDYEVPPPVSPVDQGQANLCWLAATAVLYGWKSPRPVTMAKAAERLGVEFVAKYGTGSALTYDELPLWRQRGPFRAEGQQCMDARGWDAKLRGFGPLITLVDGSGSRIIDHAVVVYGVSGDGTQNGTHLKFADGNGGTSRELALTDFVQIFELPTGSDRLFSVLYF